MKRLTPLLIKFSLEKPIQTGLALVLIALVFRLADIFIFRLDERWGEIILSKALGFALVVAFVWAAGRKLQDIGLHSRFLIPSLAIGGLVTLVAFILGYGSEFASQLQAGANPTLRLDAIDPKAGVSGGVWFAIWLVLGNFVNSFMEEGLFRGLLIRLFRIQLSFGQANWLQALLFGAWHLPWVLKWYQTGKITTPSEIAFACLANFLPQLIMGLVWGYLYLKSNNLWGVWLAHTLTNSILNLVHLATNDGLDSGMTIRMLVYVFAALFSLLFARVLIRRAQLPEVQPWSVPAA